ncbi:hypothetical protein FRC09_020896 [Ceratobasidium sp. 395]|nr:hypothetical protein FRC09_020896 [Ceratobasidium sp. 395]
MRKRIERRIHSAGEKIDRLFRDREPGPVPSAQAPADPNTDPAGTNTSASTLPTVLTSHSELYNNDRHLTLAPGASQTTDQYPSVTSLDSEPIQPDRPNHQPTNSSVLETENNIVLAPAVDGSRSFQSNRDVKSTAWSGLKALIGVLGESTGEFGPLKSTIGALLRCFEIHEVRVFPPKICTTNIDHQDQVAAHEEYQRLEIDLENVCQEISGYVSGSTPPSMESKVAELTERLKEEINLIDQKTQRSRLGRYMEAADDANEILVCYRRIQGYFDAFARNVGMSIWQIVDEQATRSRLKELPNSPAAKYCSTESRRLGRVGCTPDTRLDVMKQLRNWSQGSKSKRVYWLNGMAGTGKTTIAYSLCSELERAGQLAGSFFCSRQLPECRDVGIILPSIAYQLALSSRPYRYELSGTLERDPDVHNQPVDRQFHSLIAAPLRKVRKQLRGDLVVVFDALDECTDGDSVGRMLSALLAEAVDLPIKIFFTSRPNSEILEQMGSEQGHNVRSELRLHALERSVVQSDINTYLKTELSALCLEPTTLDELAKRSGVLFIYAATVVRYVKNKSLARSKERLKCILSAEPVLEGMIHRAIDSLYEAILKDALDSRPMKTERAEMMVALHTVICGREPLSVNAIAGLLHVHEELVMDVLQPLLPVLQISDGTRLVTTLHESFPDYLLDASRSGEFWCDPGQRHSSFAQVCFDLLKTTKPLFNICNLESSYIPNAEVFDLSNRVRAAVSDHLSYGCRYWEAHLELADSSSKLMDELEKLLSTRLFLWMEVMNLKHKIDDSVIMMSKLDVWLSVRHLPSLITIGFLTSTQRVQAPASTRELAHDAWRFVHSFASGPIRHMTPHIYISVLALWPKHRPLSRYRSRYFPGLAKTAGTALDRRDVTPLAVLNLPDEVWCIARSPDGERIISGCRDKTVCIWNAHTGQPIGEPLVGHTGVVSCVTFSPDSRCVVSGSWDQTIRIWDIYTGQISGTPLEGHSDQVNSVTYSPNGAHIASSSKDGTIRIWDVQTRQMLGQALKGHEGSVHWVAYSPNGAYIVSGSEDNTVRIWDAQTGKPRGPLLKGHTGGINTVAYSPDGAYIVSGSNDKTVRMSESSVPRNWYL